METVSNEVKLFVGKYTFVKSKSKYSPTNIKSKIKNKKETKAGIFPNK